VCLFIYLDFCFTFIIINNNTGFVQHHTQSYREVGFVLENDRFKIYYRCPMSDVAMVISTDADSDADVACLDHLVTS